jgi:hypothetical protein
MHKFFRMRTVPAPAQITGQTLPYPLKPCPPIAVFSHHFVGFGPVQIAVDPAEITSLDVRTAAAPLPVMWVLADHPWTPEYPLIVLSDFRNGLMSFEDRDEIWSKFQVPVFEYLLDSAGQIAARECEAHEGLHTVDLPGDWDAEITEEPCACGQPGARLLQMEPQNRTTL